MLRAVTNMFVVNFNGNAAIELYLLHLHKQRATKVYT